MTTKNTVSLAIGLALGLGLAAAVGAWAQGESNFGPGMMGGYGMMGAMGGPATHARYMATGPAGTNAMTEACLTTMNGNTGTPGKTTTGK